MIKLYTLRDKESGTTNQPMAFSTERDAIDGLRQVVKDPQTALHQHPEDFTLLHLGEYDPREVKFNLLAEPRKVLSCTELME
jgi:hypothetical protein